MTTRHPKPKAGKSRAAKRDSAAPQAERVAPKRTSAAAQAERALTKRDARSTAQAERVEHTLTTRGTTHHAPRTTRAGHDVRTQHAACQRRSAGDYARGIPSDSRRKKSEGTPPATESRTSRANAALQKTRQRTALKRTASKKDQWSSRIVGMAEVSPDELMGNPKNWRLHPKNQQDAIKGVLSQVGWVQNIVVNKRTGFVVDGHMRLEVARREGAKKVPVVYVDLSPKEEALVLATLDPIGAMADANVENLDALLKEASAANEDVENLLSRLRDEVGVPDEDAEDDEEAPGIRPTGIFELKEDAIFPSSNEWDIPDLRADMLYDGPLPTTTWPEEPKDRSPQIVIWGSTAVDEKVRGKVLCFYTEDYRFEATWSEAVETIERVLPHRPLCAISPDFSLYADMPMAQQLWNIYRARWVSRYWQEAGIKIIPSLATSSNPVCRKFAHAGWPKRPSVVALQMRTGGVKSKGQVDATLEDIASLIAEVNPKRLLLYGVKVRETFEYFLPKGIEYHWCRSFTDVRFDDKPAHWRKK